MADPYIRLLGSFSGSGKGVASFGMTGTVLSTSPMIIETNGIELDKDDLKKNDLIEELNKGDEVLLIPSADMQQFFIICRLEAVT